MTLQNFTLLVFISFCNLLWAQTCPPPTAIIEFEPNEVRSKLSHGGSLWWDKSDAGFAIPKQDQRAFDVHAFFAAGIWVGGFDPGGNIKFARSTYGQASGNVDFWAGPLDRTTAGTNPTNCLNWDRFFRIRKTEVDQHILFLQQAQAGTLNYTPDLIPTSIKQWPANGNPYFEEANGFSLPNDNNSFTDFFDRNENGVYEPLDGDYPALIHSSCNNAVVPTEMIYWVFNDNGGFHQESQGDPIGAEFHALAFAFNTGTSLDYTQFYRYKLVNRAVEDITETRIGLWTDPDLGCYTDDYLGCDTTRSLMYVYNEDAIDGENGSACPGGINTYAQDIPIVGIDMLGVNSSDPTKNIRTMDVFGFYTANSPIFPSPNSASQSYNVLNGLKADGQPFLNPDGNPTSFIYYDSPDCTDPDCWSMCNDNPPNDDRRAVFSTGKFTLQPGEEIELYFANVFAPSQNYPCPNLDDFWIADDLVQAAYDNCFENLTSRVTNNNSIMEANIYPNPISLEAPVLNVTIPGVEISRLEIIDIHGRSIQIEQNFDDGRIELKGSYAPGIYVLNIKTKTLQSYNARFIVTN